MSFYSYSPLPPGSIRLLRLSPHEDEQAPIHCELFCYPLTRSRKGTHLYEALSYYWGSPKNVKRVLTNKGWIGVTENLYAALLRLRDPFLERVIWADAICIDQANADEKASQVQLMAEIYARASRVIVWLEEANQDPQLNNQAHADSYQAFQAIGLAANRPIHKTAAIDPDWQAVDRLLDRAWFSRIWVLQEVAASRHVLIMCQHTEIDGLAFCRGLENMNAYTSSMDQGKLARIRSTAYLIKAAGLRSKRPTSLSERFSLDIRSLEELLDLYHTREATDPRDKVYALLGMSIDAPPSLVPDYRISWKDCFCRLLKSLLHQDANVTTWEEANVAVIRSKGYVIGDVKWIKADSDWADNVEVGVNLRHMAYSQTRLSSTWKLQASTTRIQVGDIICLLQGASQPTVLRVFGDYCAIIAFAINSEEEKEGGTRNEKARERCSVPFKGIYEFPNQCLLVWDWEASYDQAPVGPSLDRYLDDRALTCIKPELADRLTNLGILFGDLAKYDEAIAILVSAVEVYERASRMDCPQALSTMHHIVRILRLRPYEKNEASRSADVWQILADVLGKRDGYADMTDNRSTRVASICDTRSMALILEYRGEEIVISENFLAATAENEESGPSMMLLLLDRRGSQITITENVLKAAARNPKSGRDVLAVLLEHKGDQITITEDLIAEVAQSPNGAAMMLLLFGWDQCQITLNDRVMDFIFRVHETYVFDLLTLDECVTNKLVALLLERQHGQITITANMLHIIHDKGFETDDRNWEEANGDKLAYENIDRQRCLNILQMLFQWQGGLTVVTEDADRALRLLFHISASELKQKPAFTEFTTLPAQKYPPPPFRLVITFHP